MRRVFDNVMKQPGDDRGDVELKLGEDRRDFQGMVQIRLSRPAPLPLVRFGGENVRLREQGDIDLRRISLNPLHDLVQGKGLSVYFYRSIRHRSSFGGR